VGLKNCEVAGQVLKWDGSKWDCKGDNDTKYDNAVTANGAGYKILSGVVNIARLPDNGPGGCYASYSTTFPTNYFSEPPVVTATEQGQIDGGLEGVHIYRISTNGFNGVVYSVHNQHGYILNAGHNNTVIAANCNTMTPIDSITVQWIAYGK
jgi:hypothetical protein